MEAKVISMTNLILPNAGAKDIVEGCKHTRFASSVNVSRAEESIWPHLPIFAVLLEVFCDECGARMVFNDLPPINPNQHRSGHLNNGFVAAIVCNPEPKRN